tara:strand:- start:450 stop:656 length:207 start_codon:yes stop_codon:yes gene_type:complete
MDKLLDHIEILHKSINNLLSLKVIDDNASKKLANESLDILISREQGSIRNDALSYYDELDNQKKGAGK